MMRIAAALLLLLAVACEQVTLVEPGTQSINSAYEVTTPVAWSRFPLAPMEQWTIDGLPLQNLRLYAAIENGDALFENSRAKPDDGVPRYRSGMRAGDVAELAVASLARAGANDPSFSNLRPAAFGSLSGFRFDIAFLSSDGLAYRGLAFAAIDEESILRLLLYIGTAAVYFDAHRETVETIFRSVSMPDDQK
ncbi:MAG: hypothetical protein QGF53_00155 [Alphaproteobacteria bacterium]|jgi:hypothetical protein|nr:hypothetical protein [Alphaproteobacteria bacterium]